MNSPCKDCPGRAIGCHGRCERYQAFREEREGARLENARWGALNDYKWGTSAHKKIIKDAQSRGRKIW